MKNDMRVRYPVWQMGFIAIIMALVFLIGESAEFELYDDGGFTFTTQLEFWSGIIVATLLLTVFMMLILFIRSVSKHNKNFPRRKISLFSFRPQEFMDDDELFREVTRRATQKVYSFFSVALPIIAALFIILPVPRVWMVLGILALSLVQYLIYYSTIRKYVTEKG